MSGLVLAVFILACIAFWLLTLLTWPGNWGLVLLSILFAALSANTPPPRVSWTLVLLVAALAVLGEIAETWGAARGVSRAGNRKSVYLALAGSILGSVVGIGAGVPVPIVGSVVGALLGGAAGALLGAIIGERWSGSSWQKSWELGCMAFRGRLLGSFAKILCGTLMLILLIAGLWVA